MAKSGAIAMPMGSERSFEGGKLHIDSHPVWVMNNITTEEKKCCLQVPPDTEFLIYPYVFRKVRVLTTKPFSQNSIGYYSILGNLSLAWFRLL